MSEISIKRPISIEIETIETDSYLPSFKANIKLEINHPTGYFSYQANDIWFDCVQWDAFLSSLDKLNFLKESEIILSDMSEYFKIRFLLTKSRDIQFRVNIKEPFSGENGEGVFSYQSNIDNEVLNVFIQKFNALDRWW
jgi:hypothetical protein